MNHSMKGIFFILFFILNSFFNANANAKGLIKNGPWVYFDLGDTIINTKNPNQFDYYPGAHEYLIELKSHGYRIGLITNIPETFGSNFNEKMKSLKKFIAEKWIGSVNFNWNHYDDIIIPLNDKERKPKPILFARAIAKSMQSSCPLTFISENQNEISMAESMGISSFIVSSDGSPIIYPTLLELRIGIDKNFQLPFSKRCLTKLY
jgi:histidinol phosphatase-like enzyme